jgi:spermidine synthase
LNDHTSLGRHIIAELYNCDIGKISDVSYVEKSMLAAADKSGATVINSTFHHFSPFGVSGVIVIQESHFSIHCWPEFAYASVDIYTCGNTVDPWIAYEYLLQAFQASHGSTVELNRGQRNLIGHQKANLTSIPEKKKVNTDGIKHTRNIWFTQRNEHIALSLRHSGERLFLEQSPFQKIEIYQTEAFGKILVLDGKIVCAEEDEYVYHEMIAHVPVFSHPDPQKVLVIGGGDGGTVRELVKHEKIQSIDLVEIDRQVVSAAKKYLPGLAGALDHPKVNVRILDGVQFVAGCNAASYDIVIVDSDEPEGPGEGLFTESFYRDIHRVLRKNGILITQSESPRYNTEIFKDIFQKYCQIFGKEKVYCYLMYLPSFPSGMWSFSFSGKGNISPRPLLPEESIRNFCNENHLKYYSFDIHTSAFVLPKFVKDLIE